MKKFVKVLIDLFGRTGVAIVCGINSVICTIIYGDTNNIARNGVFGSDYYEWYEFSDGLVPYDYINILEVTAPYMKWLYLACAIIFAWLMIEAVLTDEKDYGLNLKAK